MISLLKSLLLFSCALWTLQGKPIEKMASEPPKIVIIGAGVSGLSAAHYLKQHSPRPVEIKILEARDRIGGRIHTHHEFGVEMGAGWIHGSSLTNPIYKLALDHNISTFLVGGDESYVGGEDKIKLFDWYGKPMDPKTRTRSFVLMEELWNRVEQRQEDKRRLVLKETNLALKGLDHPEHRKPIGKYLKAKEDILCRVLEEEMVHMNLTEEDKRLLNWHFEVAFGGDDAADPCDLGMTGYFQYSMDFKGNDSVFTHGYDSLPNLLSHDLDIELNQKVVHINYGKHSTAVTTEKGQVFKADYILLTVPLGYLKHRELLRFEPPLPKWKRLSIQRIGMGVLDRVALKFESPFWPQNQYSFGYVSQDRGEWPMIVNQHYITGRPILEFMIGGPKALQLVENRSKQEIQNHLMHLLRRLFGPNVPEPIDMIYSKWNEDPYTFGAYSYLPPGITEIERLYLAKPLNHVLYFAGEATEVNFAMTVTGAFVSGQREAKHILEQMKL